MYMVFVTPRNSP